MPLANIRMNKVPMLRWTGDTALTSSYRLKPSPTEIPSTSLILFSESASLIRSYLKSSSALLRVSGSARPDVSQLSMYFSNIR
ncbi:hypothetical protein M433DRAFT_205731 [Acidomyces richmondensis BFW]|nr:hypothetical protein M433DRAFT_205731 [Acidomyces richmondensis BFW]